MKKMFVLLVAMALVFSCTEAQKEAVVAKLFDLTGSPNVGDYTNDVGIYTSVDNSVLNVDFTGFNIDDELTRIGNIHIQGYYAENVGNNIAAYTDGINYSADSNDWSYRFLTNRSMVLLPQYEAHATRKYPDSILKFSTPLIAEDGSPASLPLQINGSLVTLKYTPDTMNPNHYTTYFFKNSNNKGYASLTLTGYEIYTATGATYVGDCEYSL